MNAKQFATEVAAQSKESVDQILGRAFDPEGGTRAEVIRKPTYNTTIKAMTTVPPNSIVITRSPGGYFKISFHKGALEFESIEEVQAEVLTWGESLEEKGDTRIVISPVDPERVPVIVAELAAIGIDSTINNGHKIVISPAVDSHPIKVITYAHRAPAILYASGKAIRLN